jgi:malate permease and related proteins
MQTQLVQIVNRIIPIIVLILVGKWFQAKKYIQEESILDLKKLVVNIALPAVLFLSFLTVDFELEYFWFLPLVLIYCVIMYFLGIVFRKTWVNSSPYLPFLTTGFEYGMLGVSLFGAAYGLDQIGKIAIVDLGQETFIWFIYVALLMHARDGQARPGKLIKMFAASPVILAILAGLALNFLGLSDLLAEWPVAGGLLIAVDWISGLTIPLILIVVGYGLRFDFNELAFAGRLILVRLSINVPAALLLNRFFVREWMGLGKGFEAALFTLLILPPPFILTLFMDQDQKADIHRVDSTLTLHTLVTIIVFVIYFSLNPMI